MSECWEAANHMNGPPSSERSPVGAQCGPAPQAQEREA